MDDMVSQKKLPWKAEDWILLLANSNNLGQTPSIQWPSVYSPVKQVRLDNLHDSTFCNSINYEHLILTNLDLSLRLLNKSNSSTHGRIKLKSSPGTFLCLCMVSFSHAKRSAPPKKNMYLKTIQVIFLPHTLTSFWGRKVKMFMENHHHHNTKIKNRGSTYSYCYMTEAFIAFQYS